MGTTLTGDLDASLRDVMTRTGDASAGSLIYQHRTGEQNHAVAASRDDLVCRHQNRPGSDASGTWRPGLVILTVVVSWRVVLLVVLGPQGAW